jgi:hypothetical protein
MEKITFHPYDIKQHGAHLGLVSNGQVRPMPYDLPIDVYDNDLPVKTCKVEDVKWIDGNECMVLLFEEDVVIEDTCEVVGTLCLIIKPDKLKEVLKTALS